VNIRAILALLVFFVFGISGFPKDPLEPESIINVDEYDSSAAETDHVNKSEGKNHNGEYRSKTINNESPEQKKQVVQELPKKQSKKSYQKLNAVESVDEEESLDETTELVRGNIKHTQLEREDSGNLPSYARRKNINQYDSFKDPNFDPKNKDDFKLQSLKNGTQLFAVIQNNILAYPDSQSPVSGVVTIGKYKNAKVIGTATLDETTKRINVEFHTIVLPDGNTSYAIKGITSHRDGELGLKGEYKTEFWKWLWAEAVVKSVSGYTDASIDKEHSLLGGFQNIPSPENAAKKGAAKGLSTIGDRFAEKRRVAPEMTEVTGPVQITITVLE
jgi:hypothetical protein